MIVSYYIIYTNHFDRPDIKATLGKINYFPIVTSIRLKYIKYRPKYWCTQLSCDKSSCGEI